MLWLLILVLSVLAIAVSVLLFVPRNAARKPAEADVDLLAQNEEAEFEASVLRKKQETALLEVERSQSLPVPDVPSEILWSEHDDVYRPAPGDARRFTQSLKLNRVPDFLPGQPLVFLRRRAYEKALAHLNSNLRIELGGLLVGQAFTDARLETCFILIEEALPADGGEGTAISFEYTSATWAVLTPQLQQMNADWTVLGSYHSHPGLGVFLSATDRNTQESVFAQDWQVALVIDPIADETGFFFGEKGKPCPHWYLVEND